MNANFFIPKQICKQLLFYLLLFYSNTFIHSSTHMYIHYIYVSKLFKLYKKIMKWWIIVVCFGLSFYFFIILWRSYSCYNRDLSIKKEVYSSINNATKKLFHLQATISFLKSFSLIRSNLTLTNLNLTSTFSIFGFDYQIT